MAVNPAGAILNYLYALLEVEAGLACLALGLDPALAFFHVDVRGRDSLQITAKPPEACPHLKTIGERYAVTGVVPRLLPELTPVAANRDPVASSRD
jgi:hypothetical protein